MADIRRRDFLKGGAIGSAALLTSKSAMASGLANSLSAFAESSASSVLARGFVTPPKSAKPHTWWHWMNGNVTKEGITADLEAMHRVGIGGVQIFNVDYQIPQGEIVFNTLEWHAMMHHAVSEANRLDMEVAMHNCSGWSSSGGPWITPDRAMQMLGFSELKVKGPVRLSTKLERPDIKNIGPTNQGRSYSDSEFYHDIAVLAYKTPADDRKTLADAKPAISSTGSQGDDVFSFTLPTPDDGKPQRIQLKFDAPYLARAISFEYASGHTYGLCEVQTSDDGTTFKTVASVRFVAKGQISLQLPQTSAIYYRLQFTARAVDDVSLRVSGLDLATGYRLPDWQRKAGNDTLAVFNPVWNDDAAAGSIYKRQDSVDLTASLKGDAIEWDVPEGDWTILRFGYAPKGRINTHPNERGGAGLEVDKMNPEALELHFEKFIDVLLKDLGPLAGQTYTTLVIDSYEVTWQNWTPRFREEFQKRYGYDMTPYLAAFTGRVIDSTEVTERFLWDVRALVSALYAEHYYGHFSELCHKRGLKAAFEPYSGPYSIMDCGDHADLPMGEFWTGGGYRHSNSRNRKVISAGHLNGRSIVGAESYTSGFGEDRYSQDPYSLKSLGDFQFCEGINRFIFHRYAMQPWLEKNRIMTMGPWGLHLERTNNWYEQASGWFEYLTRCQYLLQSGKPVADILCFAGEDGQTESRWGNSTVPPVPEGYDYEFINSVALLTATVQQGSIVVKGLSFRALLLPDQTYLTPAIAQKIAELVRDGAIVTGPLPQRSPSLSNYPACDAAVHQLASGVLSAPLDGVLKSRSIAPDFTYTGSDAEGHIVFKHRATDKAEIYFVSSQLGQAVSIESSFRITGKMPELWHPDTGVLEPAPVFSEANGRITLPLQLDPSGSVFVIFRQSATADHAIEASAPGLQLAAGAGSLALSAWTGGDYSIQTAKGRTLHGTVAAPTAPIVLDEDWAVSFPPDLGAPASIHLDKLISLAKHSDSGVRYFSGTATYSREFDISPAMLAHVRNKRGDIYLDLGVVKNLAEVKINGVSFGLLWKPPFRVAIASALHSGKNRIEVKVTDLWANRMIGDEQLPDDIEWLPQPGRGQGMKEWPKWFVEGKPRPSGRILFATWKFYGKNDPLPDSGLIGPVQLIPVEKTNLKLG